MNGIATRRAFILACCIAACPLLAEAANEYRSPYSVKFTFKPEELIGDLLKGPRADWEDSAKVPFREWYLPANAARWGYRGPGAKHYDAPPGVSTKGADWARQRVIATGLRLVGYTYQHHHVPYWDPPADWPRDETQKTPPGKGLDCSNFTAFVYNLALGIKPTGDVRQQAELTEVPGPGPNRTSPVQRIELPRRFEDYERTLRTGDLLFINSTSGTISHVVLWVGPIGRSPDAYNLILDSTGSGNFDSTRAEIPDGIHLRSFKPDSWYCKRASHVLRLIPDGPGKSR